jgi:hypothetical protein
MRKINVQQKNTEENKKINRKKEVQEEEMEKNV